VAPSHVCAGSAADVTYGFKVTNSGDFFAAAGTLVDDNGTPGNTGDDFTLGSWGPLAPGASQSFSRLRSINIASPLINTATATGTTGPGGTAAVSAQDTTVVIPQRCEIALTKTPDVCEVQEGIATPVNYSYVITNTGDYFSASGTLVDDNGTPRDPSDDFTVGSWGPIAPGQSQTLSRQATLKLTSPVTNAALAAGTSGTAGVHADAYVTVTPHRCGITVAGSTTPESVCPGVSTTVSYSYTVTNTGDFFAASGTLVDNAGTTGTTTDDIALGSWGPLAPGASRTFTRSATLKLSAPLTCTALASGTTGPSPVTGSASLTVRTDGCSSDVSKNSATPLSRASAAVESQGGAAARTLPTQFALMQNFPNPLRESTVIRFALPEASTVSVRVYNVFGQEVATLQSGAMQAGYHSVEWSARDRSDRPAPAGMYFYRIEASSLNAGTFRQMRKMILVR